MTRVKVPRGFYEVDKGERGEALVVPSRELADWCAEQGVQPKLYAEGWRHRHDDPKQVFLDIDDAEKLLSFIMAF